MSRNRNRRGKNRHKRKRGICGCWYCDPWARILEWRKRKEAADA